MTMETIISKIMGFMPEQSMYSLSQEELKKKVEDLTAKLGNKDRV